jgi:hypothetical protein
MHCLCIVFALEINDWRICADQHQKQKQKKQRSRSSIKSKRSIRSNNITTERFVLPVEAEITLLLLLLLLCM